MLGKWEGFRDRLGDWGWDVVLWVVRRRIELTLREMGEIVNGIDYVAVGMGVNSGLIRI